MGSGKCGPGEGDRALVVRKLTPVSRKEPWTGWESGVLDSNAASGVASLATLGKSFLLGSTPYDLWSSCVNL